MFFYICPESSWLLGSTQRDGKPLVNIWNNHTFNLPTSGNKSRALLHCRYLTRCDNYRGMGEQSCYVADCHGSSRVRCRQCHYGRKNDGTRFSCNNLDATCSNCNGSGKVTCYSCSGLDGSRHLPILTAK
ncbi:unnamed protein product [Rotaria socialis]|uniref:Uncharacterized protein n=1 Tax=Rotaria socialis TaxID=392032 RepID=A0A820SYQ1_9BILA|nr:unnamed protein product [Rotaria socialis]CAF3469864.1 unnamed protein product [Rotaria socialis]CAF4461351.1 unnamed protein product [Rotaria socialis]CAF4580080.1 unnamed protein product [Rotaria socialis]CAF4623808.1 unnamed protein product [Rotaria socialis]